MATSSRRRGAEDEKVVRYVTADNEFEVEVARTFNKWYVSVFQLPGREQVAQDFFPERWKAVARAQDFIRILNQRKKTIEDHDRDDG